LVDAFLSGILSLFREPPMKITKIILIIGMAGLFVLLPQAFLILLVVIMGYFVIRKYSKPKKRVSKTVVRDIIKYAFGQKPRKLMLLGEVDGVEIFKTDNLPSFIFRKGISIKCYTGIKVDGKMLGIKKINEILQWFSEKSLNGYPIILIITHNMEIRIIAESSRNGLQLTQEMVNELVMESSSTLKNIIDLVPSINEASKILETPLYDFGGV